MIGACDICNAQNVSIGRTFVAGGLETFYCIDGCKTPPVSEREQRAKIMAGKSWDEIPGFPYHYQRRHIR